jgi:hypothetical protein
VSFIDQQFDSLLTLFSLGKNNDTFVVFVEIPIHPLGIDEEVFAYGEKILELQNQIDPEAGEIILLPPDLTIPGDGWREAIHMNAVGASVYTNWMADELIQRLLARDENW